MTKNTNKNIRSILLNAGAGSSIFISANEDLVADGNSYCNLEITHHNQAIINSLVFPITKEDIKELAKYFSELEKLMQDKNTGNSWFKVYE